MTYKRLLILEPYYGGSHKQFLEGLLSSLGGDIETSVLTLPPRKWKARMQLAALQFINQLAREPGQHNAFDCVLCSSLLDVAVLRSLLHRLPGWCDSCRVVVYFHENQFNYPAKQGNADRFQFALINFNSALAADSIAFNSEYNRESFFSGCQLLRKNFPGQWLQQEVEMLWRKSRVLYPGITAIDVKDTLINCSNLPVILWNHRWEHDKNPEEFFAGLMELVHEGIDFRLILAGQAYRQEPPCFAEARSYFGSRGQLLHYGYARDREDYWRLLQQSDVVVSTAQHEYFGLAVAEAVQAGARPVLPARLSYPELYPKEYLYGTSDFFIKLRSSVLGPRRLSRGEARALTDRFLWQNLRGEYLNWLFGV